MDDLGGMMDFGLSRENFLKIEAIFRIYEEIDEVILYGSRAKGNFKPGSDIDITLKGGELNLHVLNRVALDLDDLMLPYIFDLSLFKHISNKALIDHIERVGKRIYLKKELSI